MLNNIKNWFDSLTVFHKYWIVGGTLAIMLLGIISGDAPINILIGTVGFFYVSVYSSGTTRWSFVLGCVYVGLYTIICLQNRIMIDALQNFILIPIYLYSFYHWGKAEVKPRSLTKQQLMYVIIAIIGGFVIFYNVSKLLNGNYSALDASNSIFTLAAMLLGAYGYQENWLCWSVNNVLSVITFGLVLFTPTGSITVFAMKMIFFINGIVGYRQWKKMNNNAV